MIFNYLADEFITVAGKCRMAANVQGFVQVLE
jgi:hypothetical protein